MTVALAAAGLVLAAVGVACAAWRRALRNYRNLYPD
jgi:hypothetical protein